MIHDLSTYLCYGKSQASRFTKRAFEDIAAAPSLLLEVKSGLQLGSMTVIEQENFTVGSSFDDDVFVVDSGGAISLSSKRTAIGTLVTLSSQRTDVVAAGKRVTPTPTTVRVPFDLAVSDTIISVSSAVGIVDQQTARSNMTLVQMAAVFVVLALIMGLFFVGSTSTPPRVLTATAPVAPASTVPFEPLKEASNLLLDTAMDERVTVEKRDEFTYELVGDVAQNNRREWMNIRQDLDQVFDGYNLVNRVSVTPTLSDVPAVSMVFRAPEPFLLLMDGRRVTLGAELKDGWVLESVDHDYFVVTKNADTTRLAYQVKND